MTTTIESRLEVQTDLCHLSLLKFGQKSPVNPVINLETIINDFSGLLTRYSVESSAHINHPLFENQ
jgi:hypothetical protein